MMSLLLALSTLTSAHAGSLSAALGTASTFDGDPASLRASFRAESTPTPGPVLAASLVMPVTVATEGNESFGVSTNQTLVELPPSVRVRLFPNSIVRAYGDAGAGIALQTSTTDGWLFEDRDSVASFMTRTTLGAEIGAPDGLSMLIEPASLSTYHAGPDVRATYGLMLGISGVL